MFAEPEQLYVLLSFGSAPDEVPAWEEVEQVFERIFRKYAGPEGVVLRFQRFLWQAVVEK